MKKLANITAAVLVSSLVLAGCGDDGDNDDSKSSEDAASQTTESPSDDASEDASEDEGDDSSDDASEDESDDSSDDASEDEGDDAGEDTDFGAPAKGATIKGKGYSYNIPKDWKDVSTEAKKVQKTVDTAARVANPSGTFGDNVNIGINPSPGATLDDLEATVPKQLKSMAPKLKTLPRVTVDGEEAIHHRGEAGFQGANYFLEQFAMVNDNDEVIILTFSFDKDKKPAERDKIVNGILASFDFED